MKHEGFMFRSAAAIAILIALQTPIQAQYGRTPSRRSSGSVGRGPAGASLPGELPAASFHGVLRGIANGKLSVEVTAENTLDFHCVKKTKIYDGDKQLKPSALKVGDTLSIDARRALDGSLDAVSVRVEHPKS